MRRRRGTAFPRFSHLTLIVFLSVAAATAAWVAAFAASMRPYWR